MIASKPIIVNDLVDNGDLGFVYRDDVTGSVKFFNDPSLCFAKEMLQDDNSFVLDELNDSNKLEKVFGCGTFFKLKNDQKLYTYMNNSWGCAGSGEIDSDDSMDSWAKWVHSETYPFISGFLAHEIWEIHDKYSYRPGFGLKTYFIDSTRSHIYLSGFYNNEIFRTPTEILNTEFQIKKCSDVEYGGFLYLLTNGDLYYWGDNDKNFFTSTIDRDCGVNPIKLGEKIDNIYVLGSMCIYEKEQKFYLIGYARDSYSKYILGADCKPNVKYPFPGKQITHLPFSYEYKNISKIVPMKNNVAVLIDNGELYITGRHKAYDDEVSLLTENCDKILCNTHKTLAYSVKGEVNIFTSTGTIFKEYMIRPHKYHPSIGVIF